MSSFQAHTSVVSSEKNTTTVSCCGRFESQEDILAVSRDVLIRRAIDQDIRSKITAMW